ncbi:class I SAM-dependent methyltransferase [Occallatibacter savannae]|uniref:class I SAM-dependent methyltransferase n=1 Tax=Occallatibacter savannae TaxID=1002691 RepID=UPI003B830CE6
MRIILRNVAWLRSLYHFARALTAAAFDTPARSRSKLDRLHSVSTDVWQYSTVGQSGKDRFLRESRMLDRVRNGQLFPRALEIGCHEGAFTEYLASRCGSLIAVDFSPVVLERARHRRNWENVEFQNFDLRTEAVPGTFDLIVATSVLETYYRPGDVRAAKERLIAGLRTGGYLLLGNVRGNDVFESSRWAKWLIRGGVRTSNCFSADRRLSLITQEMDDLYVDTLFHRRDAPEGSTR